MHQISVKWKQDKTWLSGEGDPVGFAQEIQIWLYYQMVYAQTRIRLGERDMQNSLRFWDVNRSPNPY